MKDLTRAAELLAELRALADNDFERHRIDVLERDLTDPPVAEQINEKHQRFDGVTYFKIKNGHYQRAISIHRAVWHYYHGDIPEGCEIHHDNENPADNLVVNLVLTTKSEHSQIHHPKNFQIGTKQIVSLSCELCGKEYCAYDTGSNRYCPDCRKKPVRKICPVCGKFFNAISKNTHYCSRSCAGKARGEKPREVRQCPICGKLFDVQKCSKKKFCGRNCAAKYRCQNRKTGD